LCTELAADDGVVGVTHFEYVSLGVDCVAVDVDVAHLRLICKQASL
jgi:hypothetical protein